MKQNTIDILENLPVHKSVISLIVPTVLAMVVQIFYNLTDTFFIGQLNDPYQVAAITIIMPVFMMLMSITGIFAVGGSSFLSRCLGEKNYRQAKETNSISIFLMIITAIVLMDVFLWKLDTILELIGSSENTYLYAKEYLKIILFGAVIIMPNFGISFLLRAEGGAKIAMYGMLIGTGTNIVLDPLFIFAFDMGVVGAAYATVLGQLFSLIFYYWYYQSGRSLVAPSVKYIKFRWHTIKEILIIGLPTAGAQIMMNVGGAMANNFAAAYDDLHLAAMGVAHRIISIVIFTFIGIANGIQPLIGYSYGAKNYKRLKDTIKFTIKLSMCISAIFVALFIGFSKYAVFVFIKDADVIRHGSWVLQVFTFAIPFASLGMIFMVSLQAMGKAISSMILSLSRQGLMYIPILILMNYLWQFQGLVMTMPIVDVLTTGLGFAFFYYEIKKTKRAMMK